MEMLTNSDNGTKGIVDTFIRIYNKVKYSTTNGSTIGDKKEDE